MFAKEVMDNLASCFLFSTLTPLVPFGKSEHWSHCRDFRLAEPGLSIYNEHGRNEVGHLTPNPPGSTFLQGKNRYVHPVEAMLITGAPLLRSTPDHSRHQGSCC